MYLLAKPKDEDHVSCLSSVPRGEGGGSEFFKVLKPIRSLNKGERIGIFPSSKAYKVGSSAFIQVPEAIQKGRAYIRGKLENFPKSQSLNRDGKLGMFLSLRVYIGRGSSEFF